MDNYDVIKLNLELVNALPDADIVGIGWNEDGSPRIDWGDGYSPSQADLATSASVVANHDPIDYVDERRKQASQDICEEPGWAMWTDAEAQAWLDTRDFSDPVQVKNVVSKMVRMIILNRDYTLPESRGQIPDV